MQKDNLRAIGAIALFYLVIELLGVTCPIRFLTGVSCAGCGMSRAWLSLLRLDVVSAYHYHPLFYLPVPAGLLLLLRKKIPERVFRGLMMGIVLAFLVVYVVRLVDPGDTVVAFSPRDGVIYRLLSGIWK